jgi:hypothetical protein
MIRDPSDGSIKEPRKAELETTTSGLPMTKEKSDELARLEKSRDWLKRYSHPDHEEKRR